MQHRSRIVEAVRGEARLPTFDQWLERSAYRQIVERICSRGTLFGQVYAMRSLYDVYRRALFELTLSS